MKLFFRLLQVVLPVFSVLVGLKSFAVVAPFSASKLDCQTVLTRQPEIKVEFKPGEIKALFTSAKTKIELALAQFLKVPKGERNFDNTLLAFENMTDEFVSAVLPAIYVGDLYPSQKIRDESTEVNEMLANYITEFNSNVAIYKALSSVKVDVGIQADLKAKLLKSFEDAGIHLAEDKRDALKAVQAEYSNLSGRFMSNLQKSERFFEFTFKDLTGVAKGKVDELEKSESGYKVHLGNATMVAYLLSTIQSPSVRKRLYKAFRSRVPENVDLLEEMVIKQQKLAEILGYKTYQEVVIDEDTLASTPENVTQLLKTLKDTYKTQSQSILEKMLALKRVDEPKAKQVYPWDYNYYDRKLRENNQQESVIDENELESYFPIWSVVESMYAHAEEMLDVKIVEIKGASTWHPDVKKYQVLDPKGDVIGNFYLDIFNREGKNPTIAYAAQLVSRRTIGESQQLRVSESILVTSLGLNKRDLKVKPNDIGRLYHEFGHILHSVFASASYRQLNGYRMSFDAVEIPSTFFEKLPWNAEILVKISNKNGTGEKMPLDMAQAVIDNHFKSLQSGFIKEAPFTSRSFQENAIFLSILDQAIYSEAALQGENFNIREVYNQAYQDFYGVESVDDGDFVGIFLHLGIGMSAQYYAYLWSHIYSTNVYFQVVNMGVNNPQGYIDFYDKFLSQDNRVEPSEMLDALLGGQPDLVPALEYVGFKK
ncbi:MAG: hypothetical protein KDD58_15375 [Bdellovibrionales bacterium]|nr:hypothetical protein [Bdellovibrionales bacterium]